MARNTSHLAPSKRLKIYSGRDGRVSLNRPVGSISGNEYATHRPGGDFRNTKVRSGANSQKEYLDSSKGDQAWSQSKQDKVKAYRKKMKK